MLTRKKINNIVQWAVLWGICLGRYTEVSCIVLVLLLCRKKYGCPHILLLLATLLLHFLITDVFTGYEWNKFLQQFCIVSIMAIGYYHFFHNYVSSIPGIWNKYIKISLWMCYIGYLQYGLFLLVGHDYIGSLFSYQYMSKFGYRMQGIFMEPGNFAAFITPAVAYCWLYKEGAEIKKKQLFIMTCALLLSFTTIGYFSLFVIFVYTFRKAILRYFWVSFVPIAMFIAFVINFNVNKERTGYQLIDGMLMKFSNTYNALSNISPKYFERKLDLSSYAIISNLWVADNAPCRLIGTGLGTHEINYKKVYTYSKHNFHGLNKDDAYSLFTRIYSEFGYLGIALILIVIIKLFNRKNSINVALSFLIMSLLIRGGHYFQYGVIFFAYCYYYTGYQKRLINPNAK